MARIVPAKAKKREGFQSSSSSATVRSNGANVEQKKKYQKPEVQLPVLRVASAQRGPVSQARSEVQYGGLLAGGSARWSVRLPRRCGEKEGM